jgi:DNA-binding MarR family transcriptional regulator
MVDNDVKSLFELLRCSLFKSICAGVLEKLDEYGLSLLQRNILLYIGRNGGCNPRDLNKMFCLKNPATVRIIQSLKRKRLIKKEKVQSDGRMSLLKATPKGRSLIENIDRKPIEKLGKMISEMTPKEQQVFRAGFEVYYKGLNRVLESQ